MGVIRRLSHGGAWSDGGRDRPFTDSGLAPTRPGGASHSMVLRGGAEGASTLAYPWASFLL